MYEEYVEYIIKFNMFREFSHEDCIALMNCIKPRINSYNKSEYITNEGEIFDSIGMIISGIAAVYKENADGNRTIISHIKSGDLFGEMVAFSGQRKWPATVVAKEECKVMLLPIEKIIGQCCNTCTWHKTLIQNFIRIISQKALILSKKVEYLTIKNLRVKISKYLIEQYKDTGNNTFRLSMNRNDFADFLNVSRPSLSREIGRMRDEGVIEFHKESFKILKLDLLKRIVEDNR